MAFSDNHVVRVTLRGFKMLLDIPPSLDTTPVAGSGKDALVVQHSRLRNKITLEATFLAIKIDSDNVGSGSGCAPKTCRSYHTVHAV